MIIDLDLDQRNALIAWVKGALGITTIWAYSGENRPTKPYAVLDAVTALRREETPALRYKSTDTFTYEVKEIFTLNVMIITENNNKYATTLINSTELSAVRKALRAVRLNCRRELGVTSVPYPINTKYEYRVSVDFEFATHQDIDDVVGEIGDFEPIDFNT